MLGAVVSSRVLGKEKDDGAAAMCIAAEDLGGRMPSKVEAAAGTVEVVTERFTMVEAVRSMCSKRVEFDGPAEGDPSWEGPSTAAISGAAVLTLSVSSSNILTVVAGTTVNFIRDMTAKLLICSKLMSKRLRLWRQVGGLEGGQRLSGRPW